MNIKFLNIILCSLMLVGIHCNWISDYDIIELEYTTIARSSHILWESTYETIDPKVYVIKSLNEIEEFQSDKNVAQWVIDSLNVIDYSTCTVIALYLGLQTTGMIEVEITKLELVDGIINIFANKYIPKGMSTDDLGWPIHVVFIEMEVSKAELAKLDELYLE